MKLCTLLMLTNCLSLSLLLFTPGCSKQPADVEPQKTVAMDQKTAQDNKTHTFNLELENTSKKTLYTCCFTYAKHTKNASWRWHKSNVVKLDDGESKTISISVYNDIDDIEHTFGVLGMFNTQREATNATYELLPDNQKLDLDLLYKLVNKKITLDVEKYGSKKSFYDSQLAEKNTPETKDASFFNILNNTKKTILVCLFTYEDRISNTVDPEQLASIDQSQWRYYKSDIMQITAGSIKEIPLSSKQEEATENTAQCYLAIFDANEQKEANACIFESLSQHKKLALGSIANLRKQTIELDIEHYGIKNNIIDFVAKPTQRINLKTIHFQGNEEL